MNHANAKHIYKPQKKRIKNWRYRKRRRWRQKQAITAKNPNTVYIYMQCLMCGCAVYAWIKPLDGEKKTNACIFSFYRIHAMRLRSLTHSLTVLIRCVVRFSLMRIHIERSGSAPAPTTKHMFRLGNDAHKNVLYLFLSKYTCTTQHNDTRIASNFQVSVVREHFKCVVRMFLCLYV